MIRNREYFLDNIRDLSHRYDLPIQSGTKDSVTTFTIKNYTLKVHGGSVELLQRLKDNYLLPIKLWEDLDSVDTHRQCLYEIERTIFFIKNFKNFYEKQIK